MHFFPDDNSNFDRYRLDLKSYKEFASNSNKYDTALEKMSYLLECVSSQIFENYYAKVIRILGRFWTGLLLFSWNFFRERY